MYISNAANFIVLKCIYVGKLIDLALCWENTLENVYQQTIISSSLSCMPLSSANLHNVAHFGFEA